MAVPKPDPAMQVYWAKIINRNGVDLAELRANLVLTPEQRLKQAHTRRKDQSLRREYLRKTPAERNEESLNGLLAIRRIRQEQKDQPPPPS